MLVFGNCSTCYHFCLLLILLQMSTRDCGGVCARVCVHEREPLCSPQTQVTHAAEFKSRSGKGMNSYINWTLNILERAYASRLKADEWQYSCFLCPPLLSASRLVSLPLLSVSASSDAALCWTFCHNWRDFVLPSRLGFSNSKLISSLLPFSHPTLVLLLSHIAGMMMVVMYFLVQPCWFGVFFSSFPWFSWLQKWMAQEKAGRAGRQMGGKRGFLGKAGKATGRQAALHLAPGRSCTFPEHTGLSLLPLNLRKWHFHPASQQSA